jgi:YidC/Oxa1 family membrane protein insertase
VLAEVLPWQWLLDGLGWLLARLYDLIPNYGIAIILLTILIKVVLFPLQWKQIRSMQHMQALQPKIKELQKKYKTDKQRLQQEQMKLYREHGVNPLGGCLPLILLYPFLIAMYSVLRPVVLEPVAGAETPTYKLAPNQVHIPPDSELFDKIVNHEDTDFLFMNLQCALVQAGTQVPQKWIDPTATDSAKKSGDLPDGAPILDESGNPLPQPATTHATLDCGDRRFPDVVPYAMLLIIMVGSSYYMQRQTQKATPPGSQTGSQQAIMKYFPLLFAFFGLNFPAGLVLYWTISNGFQVAQQTIMLRAGHLGPDAIERRVAEQKARAATAQPKEGFMQRWAARAQAAQEARDQKAKQQEGGSTPPRQGPKKKPSGSGRSGSAKGGSGKSQPRPRRPKGAPPGNQLKKRPDDGSGR